MFSKQFSISFRHRFFFQKQFSSKNVKKQPKYIQPLPPLKTNNRCLVAVLGRPNVGKSTFFNRIVEGQRKAIVSEIAGTTRDVSVRQTEFNGQEFSIVDTGGMMSSKQPEHMASEVSRIAEKAADEADIIVFMADYKSGPTQDDKKIALKIRNSKKPVVLIVNKADQEIDREVNELHDEVFSSLASDNAPKESELWERLGLGPPIMISALHNNSVYDAMEKVVEHVQTYVKNTPIEELEPSIYIANAARKQKKAEYDTEDDHDKLLHTKQNKPDPNLKVKSIRVAVVGQPNVGKSSLINNILNYERTLVSPMAGTTHDPIDSELICFGRRITLIDTAGIRKRSIGDFAMLEQLTIDYSLNAIDRCHVALLLLDARAEHGIGDQEQRLAGALLERKCSIIVAANKWDLVGDNVDEFNRGTLKNELSNRLPFLRFAPIMPVSAETGYGVDDLMRNVIKCFDERSVRFSTRELFNLIKEVNSFHNMPSKHGKKLKISFAIQSAQYPPTFILWCNDPNLVHVAYERFLENRIREKYAFFGTPITLVFRKNAGKQRSRGYKRD